MTHIGFFDAVVDNKLQGWCVGAEEVVISIDSSVILTKKLDKERFDIGEFTDNPFCGFSSHLDAMLLKREWFVPESILVTADFYANGNSVFQSTVPVNTQSLMTTIQTVNGHKVDDIYAIIIQSNLWDNAYYLSQFESDSPIHNNALIDFICFGSEEKKSAARYFDTNYYLSRYVDIKESKDIALFHYIHQGESEGRWPNAYFDPNYYRKNHSDLDKYAGNLLAHYTSWGEKELRVTRQTQSHSFSSGLPPVLDEYQTWCAKNKWSSERFWQMKDKLAEITHFKLSIIMPVYNPPMKFFKQALKTIEEQVYQEWELCIADDCSTDPAVRVFLESYAASNPKVKVCFRENNGHISAATNSAVELASGEFLIFMDQDDELTPDALAEIALYLAKHPETDVLYSDDDKNDVSGNRFAPQFKPEWSPELLLSYMYMSHIFSVRKDLYQAVGGTRIGYEGSQDYDLALRVTEKARHIGHIPKVLYHWRVLPGSTASSGNDKAYSFTAGIKAVQDALDRRGISATAIQPEWAVQAGCGFYSHEFEDSGPSVAIIIPMKNQAEVTERLLLSLENTTYKNYHVYIVDNQSDEKSAHDLFEKTEHTVFSIPNKSTSFNYSYINNEAVNQVTEEYVLFLNNDTEVITPNWLSQMVGYLQIEGVGAVGARLLYPDGSVQHAGVLNDLHHGLPGHALKLIPNYDAGYMGFAKVLKNYSCVTAACLLMRREEFNQLGQFDEDNFSVAYNDVDLCYRLINSGKRVVYAPTAELYHHEGKSRGFNDNPNEELAFIEKYKDFDEKYYNVNLKNHHNSFSIKGRSHFNALSDVNGKRVSFFTHNLNLEGAPLQLLDIAIGLKNKSGITPIIISPEDGPLRARYEALNIEVVIIPTEIFDLFPINYNKYISTVSQWFSSLNIELIYSNTILGFWAVDLAYRLNIPSIWIIHESELPFSHLYQYDIDAQKVARLCLGYAYQVIFVSEATREVYQSNAVQQNYSVIYNGFDDELMQEKVPYSREEAREKLGLAEGDVFAIMIGTVCERKGQHDLIKAINQLSAEAMDKTYFAIVGDRESDYSRELHELHQQLPESIQQKVKIVQETHDIGLYYAAADVFTCCSRIESFPRVIQEAMHCGLAIVTTPVFGIKEQVKDKVSALFYQPEDFEALTHHLESVLLDPQLRNKLGDCAQLHLRRLPTYDDMITEYHQLISEAIFV